MLQAMRQLSLLSFRPADWTEVALVGTNVQWSLAVCAEKKTAP